MSTCVSLALVAFLMTWPRRATAIPATAQKSEPVKPEPPRMRRPDQPTRATCERPPRGRIHLPVASEAAVECNTASISLSELFRSAYDLLSPWTFPAMADDSSWPSLDDEELGSRPRQEDANASWGNRGDTTGGHHLPVLRPCPDNLSAWQRRLLVHCKSQIAFSDRLRLRLYCMLSLIFPFPLSRLGKYRQRDDCHRRASQRLALSCAPHRRT